MRSVIQGTKKIALYPRHGGNEKEYQTEDELKEDRKKEKMKE
jgi:hypothetical protein